MVVHEEERNPYDILRIDLTVQGMRPRAMKHIVSAAVVVALLGASVIVLMLVTRSRDLTRENSQLRRMMSLPHPGFVVPVFEGITLDGGVHTVGATPDSSGPQVLLMFNTTCPVCRATLPAWKRIADSLQRGGKLADVVGISLHGRDTTSRYAAEHQLHFPIITFPHERMAVLYRARVVPQTLVVNAAGVVLYARAGALDSGAIDSVYSAVRPMRKSS